MIKRLSLYLDGPSSSLLLLGTPILVRYATLSGGSYKEKRDRCPLKSSQQTHDAAVNGIHPSLQVTAALNTIPPLKRL